MNGFSVIGLGIIVVSTFIVLLYSKQRLLKRYKKENEQLSMYRHIVDAHEEARKIKDKAESDASEIVKNANAISSDIISKAEVLKTEMIAKAKQGIEIDRKQAHQDLEQILNEIQNQKQVISDLRSKAKEMESEATIKRVASLRQAQQIIEGAEAKAKEIAGNAYDIAKNAEKYEYVAIAMKNLIEGYGDEYIKPSYSVFDDLAIDYGYTEAGQRFKDVKEIIASLLKTKQAATCDYAEFRRRNTAIAFVLDAFNGKADSIISRIKKDNYGVLVQEMKDAFSLVNHNGSAFREARITEAYFEARMDELKWAFALFQLNLQEKEEQRRIREQMREEERARKEFEKAIRDAQKEEEIIRKAMEKAKDSIAKASEEQRAKYEERLHELEERLKVAEEKNQRALSMAQQTKSGYVYVISNVGSFGENIYKIGMTRRLEPMERVRELGDASVPFPFDVHAMIYSENAPAMETELHHLFINNQVNKVNPRKEFFKVPISEIRKVIDGKDLNVKWTMAAEAAEYKETLAIEKSNRESSIRQKEWEERQKQVDCSGNDSE